MQRIRELVENINGILPEDTDLLKQLSAQYPYASLIQLIYAHILKKQENYNFNTQLKLAAATINSRAKLFSIIQGNHNIKVSKYHNEPVYVQTSDKIDDLPQSSQNIYTPSNDLTSVQIKQLNEIQKSDESSKTPPDKSLISTEREKQSEFENRTTSKEAPMSSPNSAGDRSADTEIYIRPEKERKIESDYPKGNNEKTIQNPALESTKNNEIQKDSNIALQQPDLESIRQKIKERFGERTGQIPASASNTEVQTSARDKASEEGIEFGEPESDRKNKFQQIPNQNSEAETDKTIPPYPPSTIGNEKKNEQLDIIRQRASKILENLNKLKKKYGAESIKDKASTEDQKPRERIISKSVSAESKCAGIDDITSAENLHQKKSEYVTSEYPANDAFQEDTKQEAEEAVVEFDLTDDTTVSDSETKSEKSESIVTDQSDEEPVDTPEINTEWILEDPENTTCLPTDYLSQQVQEESLEAEEDLQEDIFQKWMSKLYSSSDSVPETAELQSEGIENAAKNSQKENQSKKTEKLKIIDNFLSGNIQIKPKSTSISEKENKDLSKKYTETSPDLMTETLAELYLTQGHIDKAIQAFEILKLKNPEKSTYFARRIHDLKKKK